ncbi:hypothetical protein KFL_002560160, partial [Klebsormidium nitens]
MNPSQAGFRKAMTMGTQRGTKATTMGKGLQPEREEDAEAEAEAVAAVVLQEEEANQEEDKEAEAAEVVQQEDANREEVGQSAETLETLITVLSKEPNRLRARGAQPGRREAVLQRRVRSRHWGLLKTCAGAVLTPSRNWLWNAVGQHVMQLSARRASAAAKEVNSEGLEERTLEESQRLIGCLKIGLPDSWSATHVLQIALDAKLQAGGESASTAVDTVSSALTATQANEREWEERLASVQNQQESEEATAVESQRLVLSIRQSMAEEVGRSGLLEALLEDLAGPRSSGDKVLKALLAALDYLTRYAAHTVTPFALRSLSRIISLVKDCSAPSAARKGAANLLDWAWFSAPSAVQQAAQDDADQALAALVNFAFRLELQTGAPSASDAAGNPAKAAAERTLSHI